MDRIMFVSIEKARLETFKINELTFSFNMF